MQPHRTPIQLRWSDFDLNNHLRHSAYYDFGAMARIELFRETTITPGAMLSWHCGPILFKEECQFKKEVRTSDSLFITTALLGCRQAGNRFNFIHEFINGEQQVTAILQVWGDFLDTRTRKLLAMPEELTQLMLSLPRHPNFQFV